MSMTHADRREKYVSAAVRAVTEELANTSSGRNAALNKAAHRMGQFIGAGMLGQDEAATLLVNACEANGYVRKDGVAAVRSTIKSGLNAGMKEPQPDLPATEPFTPGVRSALKQQVANTQQAGLTLAQFAAEKKLPVDALAFFGVADGDYAGLPCVRIPNKRRDGSEARARVRAALTGNRAHRWEGNEGEIIAYEPDGGQLARTQRYLVVNEGESDTLTLLFAGIPALGVPGADFAKVLTTEHLVDVDRVLISVELNEVGDPDSGAERFVPNVRARLEALGFKGTVHELRMPEKAKDPSALWVRNPEAFPALVLAAIETASKPPRPAYLALSEMVEHALRPVGARLRTGIETLDTATRGGIPMGRIVVLAGAPGSYKTGAAVSLGHTWERAGCAVAIFAADEPAAGIVTRLGQLAGFSRDALECEGDVGDSVRKGFARAAAGRFITVIDPGADESMRSIEDAEKALLHLADGRQRVLIVDSLQTAPCAAAESAETPRERIDLKLAICKGIASRGTTVILISEMSRAGYRSGSRGENISALAASKESGSIEYGASLLLGLRSVAGEPSLIDVEVAKNRLGGSKPEFRLKLDFDRASFVETERDDVEQQCEVSGKRARAGKLRTAILDAVRAQRLVSATAVYKAVKGTKSEVLAEVKDLVAEGLLVIVDGAFRVAVKGDDNAQR